MNSTQQPSPCCTSKLIPRLPAGSLKQLAAAVLAEFGVDGFPLIAGPDPEDPPGANR